MTQDYPRYLTWFDMLEYYSFQNTHYPRDLTYEFLWRYCRHYPGGTSWYPDICIYADEMNEFIANHPVTKFHKFLLHEQIGWLYYQVYDRFRWKFLNKSPSDYGQE